MTQPDLVECFIVDDDQDDQELFCAAIEQTSLKNYTCVFACDGAEALEKLTEGLRPHCIFLDLNMPRVNGLQCLAEIRNNVALRDIPIAIYTTSDDESIKAQALSLGATSFITKPDTFISLINKIDHFFKAYIPSNLV